MKLISYFLIARPLNFTITFFVVVAAGLISSEKNSNLFIIFFAALSAALTASAGNVINDYFDIKPDKINHPQRPLPSEKISKKEALFLYFFLVIISIIISTFINQYAFLILLIAHLILFLYSFKIKSIPFIGNFTVAFLTGLTFIFGGISVNNLNPVIIPAIFAFIINLIRELVKDMQDVSGDKENNIKTLPVLLGNSFAKKIILFFSVILILFSFYPFITGYYKIEYFILVMMIVNPFLVYCMKILFENDSWENLNKISKILKLNMIFGLAAIYFGT